MTSLGLLKQYNSDSDQHGTDDEGKIQSDAESVVEVPGSVYTDYRNRMVGVILDSDDDSSSDSDVHSEHLKSVKNIDACQEIEDDDCDIQCDDKGNKRSAPKVKGELLLEDLPPIQDLYITVTEDVCVELGHIHSIVDSLVLVSVIPNSLLLDLDTVLFLEKGVKVLGVIFDVLGQVVDPLYCIRFNSHEQILEKGIKVGDIVYVAPKTEHTQFLILSKLMKVRGSDASWENDVEPPPQYVDYSDDEEERMVRAQLRNKDRGKSTNDHMKTVCSNEPPFIMACIKKRKRIVNACNNDEVNVYNLQTPIQQNYMDNTTYKYTNSWHSNCYPITNYMSALPPENHVVYNTQPPPMQLHSYFQQKVPVLERRGSNDGLNMHTLNLRNARHSFENHQ